MRAWRFQGLIHIADWYQFAIALESVMSRLHSGQRLVSAATLTGQKRIVRWLRVSQWLYEVKNMNHIAKKNVFALLLRLILWMRLIPALSFFAHETIVPGS
jgi:hypothetical protein